MHGRKDVRCLVKGTRVYIFHPDFLPREGGVQGVLAGGEGQSVCVGEGPFRVGSWEVEVALILVDALPQQSTSVTPRSLNNDSHYSLQNDSQPLFRGLRITVDYHSVTVDCHSVTVDCLSEA